MLVYHGAAGRTKTVEEIAEYRVVITTYGMIATRKPAVKCPNYTSKLWNQQWDRIIYDESHHLRNAQTGLFRGASRLLSIPGGL